MEVPPLSEQQITYQQGPDVYASLKNGNLPTRIDTTLNFIHWYEPPDREPLIYRGLGNLGSAHFRTTCCPEYPNTPLDMGLHQYDLYKFHKNRVPFYFNTKVYTVLKLIIGQKKEQAIEVSHSQLIKNKFLFGFHYQRFGSDGFYQRQVNRHNDLALTGTYTSPKGYRMHVLFLFNNIQANENGGVQRVNIFSRDTSYQSKSLLDVQLIAAQNHYQDLYGEFSQSWSLGKHTPRDNRTVSTTGTLATAVDTQYEVHLLPRWQVFHELYAGRERYQYEDTSPDSAFYGPFSHTNSIAEAYNSVLSKTFFGTQAGMRKFFVSHKKQRGLALEAAIAYSINRLSQHGYKDTLLHHLELTGSFFKTADTTARNRYAMNGRYSFIGYNKGDWQLNGYWLHDFNLWGNIRLSVSFSRSQPAWIFHRFAFNQISWKLDLEKNNVLKLSGSYHLPRHTFHVALSFFSMHNLTLWGPDRLPLQYAPWVHMWAFEIRKLFRIRYFGIDNFLRVQWTPADAWLRYPVYQAVHTLFYERPVFRQKLLMKVGLDIRYNTNYRGYGYFPLTGALYLQDEASLSFYPVMDLYLSFKIKTVRIFFAEYHINQGMFGDKGYFSAYRYPASDRHFRFGVWWIFLD
ncbi:MAG: hypothetical protein KatS3mg031_1766 [Chitinophagales bacterium]|nr:MAG: hypothetical protein KatS3mg031_1766 [Chitinophagales bacterium]